MIVYTSNSVFGQSEICETDNFNVAFIMFQTYSRFNDRHQTCYLIVR